MAAAIFLSYVEEDSATVLPLARELRRLGHSTWTFEENGGGGRSYLEAVHDAICSCPGFLLLASAASVRSHQVLKEIELGDTARDAETAASDVVKDIIANYRKVLREPIPEPVSGEMTGLSCGGLGKKAIVGKFGEWNKCKHCGGTGA